MVIAGPDADDLQEVKAFPRDPTAASVHNVIDKIIHGLEKSLSLLSPFILLLVVFNCRCGFLQRDVLDITCRRGYLKRAFPLSNRNILLLCKNTSLMLFSDCKRNSLQDTDRSVFLSGDSDGAVIPITAESDFSLTYCGCFGITFRILALT